MNSWPAESVATLLDEARGRLADASIPLAPREARLLLSFVTGQNEAALLAHGEREVGAEAKRQFLSLIARRCTGEPVAYLLGRREFYGRDFEVGPGVLIPRPETEHLVELALELARPAERVLDVGTGSGCIAHTLALERRDLDVSASDRSLVALDYARRNRARHQLEARVSLLAADRNIGVDLSHFGLVVSNPPYIERHDAADLARDIVDFEPHDALFLPDDEPSIYRSLLARDSPLTKEAYVAFELGAGAFESTVSLAERRGFELVRRVDDYAGTPRAVAFRRDPIASSD